MEEFDTKNNRYLAREFFDYNKRHEAEKRIKEMFDDAEFRYYLNKEFFEGNEIPEIEKLINEKQKNDSDFAEKCNLFLKKLGYDSFLEYYKVTDAKNIVWDHIYFTDDRDVMDEFFKAKAEKDWNENLKSILDHLGLID